MAIFDYLKRLTGDSTLDRIFTHRVTFHETLIGSGADIAHLTISPDGKREAYLVKHGDKWAVAVDGTRGRFFDGIGAGSLTFSPDGKRLAYAAERDGKWVSVVDGVESMWFERIGAIVFSPDSKNVAFSVSLGKKTSVVVDGRARTEYEGVNDIGFVDHGFGWQPAYIAKRGTRFLLVVGSNEGKEYERIGSLVANPYTGDHYSKPGIRNLVFSPDNKHVGFCASAARHGGPWNVVRDGIEESSYPDFGEGLLTFSEDTGQLAYVAVQEDGKWVVVRDHEEFGVYDSVAYLGFSQKGKHLVWTVKVDGGYIVFCDKAKGRKFEEVDSVTFSPCGERLAYRAMSRGKWIVVLEGTECKTYEGIGEGSLVFTGDSGHIAYVAGERDKFFVVIDATESERYDGLQAGSLIASSDGRFVAYQVTRRGQSVIRVNKQESLAYDGFLKNRKSFYCRDNTFHVIAARDGKVFRVDVRPEL